jgi:16S rRNA G966 N2-methylase RsmD
MQIYDYLNKREILRKMSDQDFELFLPDFCHALEQYGFQQLLTYYNSNLPSRTKDWHNLQKAIIEKNYVSSTSTVGLNIIKPNMPHIYDVKNHKGKCISELWNSTILEKVIRVNRKTHSTPYISEIIRQLGFVAGTSKVTIYRPILTKRIVQYYDAKQVLDVCTGWGGRMLGSVSVDNVSYTGIEPYSKTFQGLEKIKKDLNFTDSQVTLYNDTAENVLPTLERKYDLALTSPPYFNLELYTDEATQSHHYGTYEMWIKKFLRPVIEGVLSKLVEGGKSCWSVKNFKTDSKYNLYDDVVKIHQENGWTQEETEFYVGNCLRPGLKDSDGNARKSKEITYIFSQSAI